MTTALLIFPHQLFADHPALKDGPSRIVLIEDPLFFGDQQYPMTFHKQKLWLHRASMTRYQTRLEADWDAVETVSFQAGAAILKDTIDRLADEGVETLLACDPVDFSLEKRLRTYAAAKSMDLRLYASPMFLNTKGQNQEWRSGQKRWFMAEFYKFQRRRLNVLMDGDDPVQGKWSFDEENRKKVPKKLQGQVPHLNQ
jgi:deoxyribodipyrimidine photolyase-related protein